MGANLLELMSLIARTTTETAGMVDLLRLVELNIARILQQAKPKSNRFNTSKYRATKRHIGYYLINFMIDDLIQLLKVKLCVCTKICLHSVIHLGQFFVSDQIFYL